MSTFDQATQQELTQTAQALVAPGKGILAADESTSTIDKRFKAAGIANNETNRRDYREMLFGTPGVAEYISGVILYDETIRQKAKDGTPFVDMLKKLGIIPGIKVDAGAKDMPGHPGEKITEGLDGLDARMKEYYAMGARFAKWRAVINIGDGIPSDTCLRSNAEALARYAAICQANKIVPIVEPEVIMDGAHTIERCYDVTTAALTHLFVALARHRVMLEGILLKPNMVVSGTECSRQADVKSVAAMSVKCYLHTVPAAVPGIVFLSGGQSDELATAHLNEMNVKFKSLPWQLSYSYGRALQAPSIKAWAGKHENVQAGRKAFLHRSRLNSAARHGKYTAAMEKEI
jgi:fructose-bisphosphate aldolase class I